jgi:hypothetical protein
MALTADYVTNQPLTFKRMRQLLEDQGGGIQEGVVAKGATTEFRVSQRAAGGANMSVDVQLGGAWVEIDTGALNGFSHIVSDALANVVIPAAHATLPRIDQIVLQYNDTAIPAGVGGDVPTLRVISGTATTGATNVNRTGAAALPNDCVRLADVQVDAAVASILDAKINDRRPWARGANWNVAQTTGDYVATVSIVQIESQSFECSGAPLEIHAIAEMQPNGAVAGYHTSVWPLVDGVVPPEQGTVSSVGILTSYNAGAAGQIDSKSARMLVTPTPGKHTIGLGSLSNVAGGIVRRNATKPLRWGVRELILQNSTN